MGAAPVSHEADGRILPATRWASLVVFAILVPALAILWGFPGRTADAWAWAIEPEYSAIFLGSGYGAGAYFFLRTFLGRRWHPSAAGVLGAGVFAALMLVATLVHWERFNHGDAPFLGAVTFYGWVIVYVVSPAVVLGLWALNRRTDRSVLEPDRTVPRAALLAARVVGAGAVAMGALFLLSPETMIGVWGWELTPLTARIVGCFTAQVGVGALWLSYEERWSGWRLIVQTFFVATALLLVGAVRAWEDFDTSRPAAWAFLGVLVGGDVALAVLYRRMIRLEASRNGAV